MAYTAGTILIPNTSKVIRSGQLTAAAAKQLGYSVDKTLPNDKIGHLISTSMESEDVWFVSVEYIDKNYKEQFIFEQDEE